MYSYSMPDRKEDSKVVSALKKATSGLLFQSEADYPYKAVQVDVEGRLTANDILRLKQYPPGTPVKTLKLEQFFAGAVEEKDWHGPEELSSVQKHRELVDTLRALLSGIKVYKVGKINMDVYVIGKTKEGSYAGVSTKIVET